MYKNSSDINRRYLQIEFLLLLTLIQFQNNQLINQLKLNSNQIFMKSKYLNIKKLKEPFDDDSYQKKNRKQTKPKKHYQIYYGQQNQTQSDNKIYSKSQQNNRNKLLIKNIGKKQSNNKKSNPQCRYMQTESSNSQNNQNSQTNSNQIEIQNKLLTRKRKTDSHQHSNFIGQLNTYLKELKRSKLDLKQQVQTYQNTTLPFKKPPNKKQHAQKSNPLKLISNKLKPSTDNSKQLFNQQREIQNKQKSPLNSNRWQKKIKKQKTINRNLQKCIIEIQKVLWDRNDKLQILQQELRKQSRNKSSYSTKKFNEIYNDRSNFSKTMILNQNKIPNPQRNEPKSHHNKHIIYGPKQSQIQNSLNRYSKIQQRNKTLQQLLQQKTSKLSSRFGANNEICQSSTQKQSDATFKQKGRRKTQTQTNIEKVLSKTLLNRAKQRKQHQKSYNKFINKDFYNI